MVIIPAPEMPPSINKGGSQHQLDAMQAANNAPKLAYRSARSEPSAGGFDESVAPGDSTLLGTQQSAWDCSPVT